jgi:hypothetical protein
VGAVFPYFGHPYYRTDEDPTTAQSRHVNARMNGAQGPACNMARFSPRAAARPSVARRRGHHHANGFIFERYPNLSRLWCHLEGDTILVPPPASRRPAMPTRRGENDHHVAS